MVTSGKCALVVDDSKSARVVLRKMLEKHSLDVELASSAEEAIDFLSRHSPDVIFMDHMMPGMDGFQAIKHIKDNPRTAMIPIVMYTSQDGEVYVGQARALGAVDVLAKDIRPTQLNNVLTRLNLAQEVREATAAPAKRQAAASRANQVRVNLSDAAVQRLARETSDLIRVPESPAMDSDKVHTLLEEQRLNLRQDITSASRGIQSQVGKKFEALDSRIEYFATLLEKDAFRRDSSLPIHLGWLVVVLVTLLLTWFIMSDRGDSLKLAGEPRTDASAVIAALEQENRQLKSDLASAGSGNQAAGIDSNWLDTLQWAVNLSSTYAYTDVPLNDGELLNLRAMVDRLERNGFRGQIQINVHVGNFCTIRNAFDRLEPAAGDVLLSACDQRVIPADEALAIGRTQSINFANYVGDLQPGGSSPISLNVVSHGNSRPRVDYPATDESEPALQWNNVAQQNNRIEYRFIAGN